MKSLKDMKIGTRLNLLLSLTFLAIMIGIGLYMTNTQRDKIISDTDTRMFEQVNDLTRVIDIQVENQSLGCRYGAERNPSRTCSCNCLLCLDRGMGSYSDRSSRRIDNVRWSEIR